LPAGARAALQEQWQGLALQHNRLAHAELNALARIGTEAEHQALTLWSTQHPCSMCAAAAPLGFASRVAGAAYAAPPGR